MIQCYYEGKACLRKWYVLFWKEIPFRTDRSWPWANNGNQRGAQFSRMRWVNILPTLGIWRAAIFQKRGSTRGRGRSPEWFIRKYLKDSNWYRTIYLLVPELSIPDRLISLVNSWIDTFSAVTSFRTVQSKRSYPYSIVLPSGRDLSELG